MKKAVLVSPSDLEMERGDYYDLEMRAKKKRKKRMLTRLKKRKARVF